MRGEEGSKEMEKGEEREGNGRGKGGEREGKGRGKGGEREGNGSNGESFAGYRKFQGGARGL